MQKLYYLLLGLISMVIITACTPPPLYSDTNKKICNVATDINKNRAFNSGDSPATKINTNFYSQDVYRSGQSPEWLNRPVTLRANDLPLNLLMNKLIPQNTVGVQYGEGSDKNTPVSLNYSGSIRGALDEVSAKTNYAYNIEDNMITWSAFVTKTFDVSFMPGASQYLMGQKQGDTMLNLNAGANGGTVSGQNADSQFSSLEGNLSVWNDLQASIKEMLSPDGKVMVSQSTTTITVQDHPENVQKVADYLASMNKDLSKEVLLKVQVLEVSLDKNFNYGIDWNVAYQTASGRAGFGTGNLSQPFTFTPLGGNTPFGPTPAGGGVANPIVASGQAALNIPGISGGIISGPFANTQLLINALAQQGNVSTVTNPEVVTLNNQVAQIDISNQQSYLASTTTTLGGVGSISQTSLTPGVVNTGFKLYILPKIMQKNIYLQLSSELSILNSITPFTSGASTIELPSISGKHFNLRSLVTSGDTLIIAGFRQTQNTANTSSMFGTPLLGGRGADQNKVETIVLITPVLMGSNS
jgi:type II secretory pathway component GspD/PulD (secretin)